MALEEARANRATRRNHDIQDSGLYRRVLHRGLFDKCFARPHTRQSGERYELREERGQRGADQRWELESNGLQADGYLRLQRLELHVERHVHA